MTDTTPQNNSSHSSLWFLIEAILVLGIILAQAGWAVPSVNESHYLTKAKHFWNPDWASGDFFLQSKDAHWLYFAGFGWLTLIFSLSTTAWIIRLVIWSILAISWTRLSHTVVSKRFFAVLSMAIFVATQKRMTLAIEWVVDGIEAKVLAYAFVFLGLADVLKNRWARCWIFFGLAIAWHPVVGGWATLSALAFLILFTPSFSKLPEDEQPKRFWLGALSGFVIAIIGVIPPLMIDQGTASEVTKEAHQIHVYKRLAHHLYPPGFRPGKLENHVLMLAAWIGFGLLSMRTLSGWKLQLYVLLSLGITLSGILIWLLTPENSSLQAGLLRFYWFRFFDVMVAVGMSLGVITFIASLDRMGRTCWIVMLSIALSVNFLERGRLIVSGIPGQFKMGSKDPDENQKAFADWMEVTTWVRNNTPSDATFITPVKCQTFPWYTERGQAASWKDVPQNAKDVVEWHRRMDLVYQATTLDNLKDNLHKRKPEELQAIGKELGTDFLLYFAENPIELPKVYSNSHFVVYSLK